MSTSARNHLPIEPVTTLEGFDRCVDLQLTVWRYSNADLIPRRVFLVAQRIGGQVLGAFDGEVLAGFAMGLPGYRNGKSYLHSHMLAVLPAYRNTGLGRRLKLAQRDDAIARGIELMEWTFDPLEIKNAHLNLHRLGAISRRYQRDFYGPSSSPLQGGLPTDRLYAEWWLRSDHVIRTLSGGTSPEPLPALPIELELEVPAAIYQWKSNPEERGLALDVQQKNREAMEAAFARGLAAIGYERDAEGNGRYLLGSAEGLVPQGH